MAVRNAPGPTQAVILPIAVQFMNMVRGNSNKFYTIVDLTALRPNTHAILYGRHSTRTPQFQLVSTAVAQQRSREKLNKGYEPREVDSFDGADSERFNWLLTQLRGALSEFANALNAKIVRQPGSGAFRLTYDRPATAPLPGAGASPAASANAPDSLTLSDMFQIYVVPGAPA